MIRKCWIGEKYDTDGIIAPGYRGKFLPNLYYRLHPEQCQPQKQRKDSPEEII